MENKIEGKIKNVMSAVFEISVDQITEGQASTCGLAGKYLKNDDQVFINACDS